MPMGNSGRMSEQNVQIPCNAILFSNKEEQRADTHYSMDEPGKYAQWEKAIKLDNEKISTVGSHLWEMSRKGKSKRTSVD